MRIGLLILLQIIVGQNLPTDTTANYPITADQQKQMLAYRDNMRNAMRSSNAQAQYATRHAYWLYCRSVIKANKLPVTAVCDLDKATIHGKDTR